jgi:hypothetical protein
MGYLDHRRKQLDQSADQKWDYINLNDFKARGCGPGFAYFWLWLLLFISVAVYALDSFTAVNLLILNKWSSKIQPGIPFQYSKWIFSGCILLSFINFAYEAWRAIRVIKRNNVAESYLDPLAVRWESIRMGSGQGWKRFLVFAELTKGQKGAEYAALFTYFSLQCKCILPVDLLPGSPSWFTDSVVCSLDPGPHLLRPSPGDQCLYLPGRVRQ